MLRAGRTTIAIGALPGRDGFLSIDILQRRKAYLYYMPLHLVPFYFLFNPGKTGGMGDNETKPKTRFLLPRLIIRADFCDADFEING